MFGRYRIVTRLGTGGMGEVYLADDPRLGRKVALKLLAARGDVDVAPLKRLEHEARTASALNHPHIMTVYDVGDVEGAAFIATEHVEGETLRRRLARGPVPLPEALDVAHAIAQALAAAHARGIVHRDVKPENIMVRPDGVVKLLDFGIATLAEARPLGATLAASATDAGAIVGTLHYLSPEQARGEAVDARTDVFSLGVVLHEMLSGRAPFDGPSAAAVIVSLLNDAPPPLPRAVLDAAPALGGILARALARHRDDRYARIADLAADVREARLALEIAARMPASGRGETTVSLAHSAARRGNLPIPPTPIIGRDAELARIDRLFGDEAARLVVLTGPGGSGKTRLALEAAARVAPRLADGVVFVSLAPLQDPELVPAAIAHAVGLKERPDAASLALLEDHLRSRTLLLVLDNFEHILAAAGLVSDLLAACPGLRALVTSRAALRLRGEYELPVPPLHLPDLVRLPPVDELARVDSIALFAGRARAVRPDFAITPENAATVAEICGRLDGLPLALELAAARIALLTPADLLARLARRLPLPSAGPRDLPARQKTLGAAIGWSYQLLGPAEQRVFDCLAVFAGGFTLTAAEAICGGDLVLDPLDTLVSSSLVRRQEAPDQSSRFTMLETIREFASERLAEHGDPDALRRRHARFYLALAEDGAASLAADPAVSLDLLEGEHDNLRAAIDWAVGAGEADTPLRLGAALWRFWEMRGFVREGSDRLESILAVARGSQDPLYMKVRYAAGVLADAAGRYALARTRFSENLAAYRAAGDDWGVANSLNNLGIAALRQNDYDEARRCYTESLSLWRKLGNRHAVALSLNNLGNVANLQKDFDAARALHEESLAIFRELGDERGIALTLHHLGDVSRDRAEQDAARQLYEEAFGMFRRAADASGTAGCLTDLGHLARERGEPDAARTMYQEAAVMFGELGDARGIARVLEGFAALSIDERQVELAFTLAGAASALRESIGAPLPPRERAGFDARLASAGEASLELRRQWLLAGRALPVEQAIALALDTPARVTPSRPA